MSTTPPSGSPNPLDDVTAFARTIFHRADRIDDVVPADFRPNWADRPAQFRSYGGRPQIMLPSQAGLIERYARLRSDGCGKIDADSLSTLMYLMVAPLRRKLDLSWNTQTPPLGFNQQEFHRGSASGGGLYPTQIHLVGGLGHSGTASGVYHYSPGHHGLTPLRRGDHRGLVARAISGSEASSEAYLVLTSDFWQNCFKYHNFGYHVCSQDVGAMIATAHLAATALGIPHRVHLAFDDAALENLIGITPDVEGVLAVIALGEVTGDAPGRVAIARSTPAPRQRSREVRIPQRFLEVHAATRCPLPKREIAATPGVRQSEAEFDRNLLDILPQVLMRRRSSWGSMRGAPFPVARLEAVLGFMSRHIGAKGTLVDAQPMPGSIGLVFQANDVAGLERGAYRWDATANVCDPVASSPPTTWQSTYSMLNYNIDTTGCVLFITANLSDMTSHYGPAGYRLLNAHIGFLAQLAYSAAAALDLDCGVVLGVCAQKVKKCVTLSPGHEVMLAVYLGGRQPDAKLFDFRFIPGAQV